MLAYVKIVPIKQGTHLDAAVDYIKNPEETVKSLENMVEAAKEIRRAL